MYYIAIVDPNTEATISVDCFTNQKSMQEAIELADHAGMVVYHITHAGFDAHIEAQLGRLKAELASLEALRDSIVLH